MFAVGAYLSKGAFDRWLAERLTGLNVNVRYRHTKYMLVDPLGASPLMVSGVGELQRGGHPGQR